MFMTGVLCTVCGARVYFRFLKYYLYLERVEMHYSQTISLPLDLINSVKRPGQMYIDQVNYVYSLGQ